MTTGTHQPPLHVGYGVSHARPGTVDTLECAACGARMQVERNAFGPTSAPEAMMRKGHVHDRFTCPNAHKAWHPQAVSLRMTADRMASRLLRGAVVVELELFLVRHRGFERLT